MQPLTQIPTSITAGASLTLRLAIPAFLPKPDRTLRFVGASGSAKSIDLTATSMGNVWVLALIAPQNLPIGNLQWQLWGITPEENTLLESGFIRVAPCLLMDGDPRSHAQKCLDAVTAVLEGRASEDMIEMEVHGGRRIKLCSHAELLKFQAFYAAQVRVEQGKSQFTLIQARFK